MTIREELLLKRGFSKYDIDTNFAYYNGEWNITTITKEQVAAVDTRRELSPLFYKDSVENKKFCETYIGGNFESFAEALTPFEVSPSQLDPHIARLCRAVNEIGVKTCMSCDGWHKNNSKIGSMQLYMKDRYSVLWFWLITEYVFGEHWKHSAPQKCSWYNIWEPFNYDPMLFGYVPRDMMSCAYSADNHYEAENVFEKNNCYAEFLERNKASFLRLREQVIDTLREKMKSGAIEDIDTAGFMQARRYMAEIFLPYAKPLSEEFMRAYPNIPRQNG